MIHGRVTLHDFTSMIVIHDSLMICHVEKFVQIRQNFLCLSVLIKWRFIVVVYCRLLLLMEFQGYINDPGSIKGAFRHRAY